MDRSVFDSGERMVLVTMGCALLCMAISIVVGALGALSYIPEIGTVMSAWGLSLVQIRPMHTTFASAWLYVGCVACIYAYLFKTHGAADAGDRLRFRVHMVCWGLAGLGALVTLPFGIGSGREYLGFHPVLAVPILLGWLVFLWTFLRRVAPGFWRKPVYVYMWTAGALLFVYTFAEGHAHLLPFVSSHPVADLQIQWKSCGTLVASFNQMVYGCLLFVGERTSGNRSVAQSRPAFALFFIGLLNSFTNYVHHTYHLPQDHLVKWIAFAVSMLEIVILWNLLSGIVAGMQRRRALHTPFSTATRFFSLSKHWNAFLLPIALLISVPPLNALVHGTHVVMAHAMGSELAIDTYILLGAFAWVFALVFPKRETGRTVIDGPRAAKAIRNLNGGLAVLVACLVAAGMTVAVTRYLSLPRPDWMDAFPIVFVLSGLTVGYSLLQLVSCWLPLFHDPLPHRLFHDDPRWNSRAGTVAAVSEEAVPEPVGALQD